MELLDAAMVSAQTKTLMTSDAPAPVKVGYQKNSILVIFLIT